jgi:hypothetical protein
MADEQVIVLDAPFTGESWSDTPPVIEQQAPASEPTPEPAASAEPTPPAPEPEKIETEEIIDSNNYLKSKWGWENEEAAEAEIKELRELKQKGGSSLEFSNEDSKKLYEYIKDGKEEDVYSFLDRKKKVEKLATADVSNKNVAAELVKFGIKNDNPTLSEDDVDFMFNERYSIPSKPVELPSDTEDEYQEKVSAWERQVEALEKRLVIEAKMQQPKMAQLKTELVLPNIERELPNQQQQTQEELQKVQQIRDNYLQKLENDYKNFNGYEVKYKDEEVEIPVNFVVPDEDKVALKKELESFDVDAFIEQRWFKDGQPNITQMMEDVTLLRSKEAVFQKIASEVGAKMKLHYMGQKANVNVGGNQQTTFNPNTAKSHMDEQIDFIWKNS